MFDSLRYVEAQPDYQQKLLDVSYAVFVSFKLNSRNEL